MRAQDKKKFNIVAGILFSILGLILVGMGVYMSMTPNEDVTLKVITPTVDPEACKSVLSNLGYRVSGSDTIEASEQTLDDPAGQLSKASLGISACGLKLTEFCMGTDCPIKPKGLKFKLDAKTPAH